MATTPQEKSIFMNKNTPLHDHEQEEDDIIDDYEATVSPSGCNCFQHFCFKWRRNNYGNEHGHLLHHEGEYYRDSWLVNKLKKVKEVSESLAGPKFKTFIRKISGYCNNKKQKNRFQYDAHSYALNFDNGVDREDDGSLLDFSATFAAPSLDDRRRAGSGM